MKKFTNWLKKIGIIKDSCCATKDVAEETNETNTTDEEMTQSQEETNKQETEEKKEF